MQASEFVAAQAPLGNETEIHFVTRTCVEQQNAPRRDPRNGQAIFDTFYDVVLHLLNRIGGLQQLYGIGWSGQRDFLKQRDTLLRSAKAINRVSVPEELKMEYEEHYSSSRQRYEPFDGFRGKLCFAGEMAPFAELLRLGEIVHVGQQTSYGLGQFTLSSGRR